MSDLHLEFGALDRPIPHGDVLILAGDITLIGVLDKGDELHHRHPELHARTVAFFTEAAKNFRRVFYLMGNHEAYSYNISKAPRVIRHRLPMVEFLDDRSVHLSDDVVLVGGTLWTDMNMGKAHDFIGGKFGNARMNDFNLIWKSSKGGTEKFTTYDAAKRFRKTIRVIEEVAETYRDKTVVVATHHAPSYRGINPEHGGGVLDAGYASDLEAFIKTRHAIKHWIHGHTHIQAEYEIGHCTVHSNGRGYYQRERSAATFNPDTSFEVAAERAEAAA